jgi:hypothetical protein
MFINHIFLKEYFMEPARPTLARQSPSVQVANKMAILGDSMRGYVWKITPETAGSAQIELLEKQALCSLYERILGSANMDPVPAAALTRFNKTKEKIALGLRIAEDQLKNDPKSSDLRAPLIHNRIARILRKTKLEVKQNSLPSGAIKSIEIVGLNSRDIPLAKKQQSVAKLAECVQLLKHPRMASATPSMRDQVVSYFTAVVTLCQQGLDLQQKEIDSQKGRMFAEMFSPDMKSKMMRMPQERFSLLYVEKVLDAKNAKLCPTTFEGEFNAEIEERAFKESSSLLILNSSASLMNRQDFLSGKHPFIACLPTFEAQELQAYAAPEKFAEKFAELLRLATIAQKQNGLGCMGIFVECQGASLVISMSLQGTFGVVTQNLQGVTHCFVAFKSAAEVVKHLSEQLFGSAQVIKGLKWTPLYNKTLQPTAPVSQPQAIAAPVKSVKPTFGEVRFKFALPKGSKFLVVRGDKEAGLGDWKQAFPVQFDQGTGEWVFPLRSNKGLFKFVLDDKKWETAGNRNCAKIDNTPPNF